MRKLPHKPVLFFDFDNTLTHGDLLDELIERYSPNEAWRDWEHAWAEGKLPPFEEMIVNCRQRGVKARGVDASCSVDK